MDNVNDHKGGMKVIAYLVSLLILLAILFGVWSVWSGMYETMITIDKKTYQAVFLTNDQVYFGKLENLGPNYLLLNDVYYMQIQDEDPSKGLKDSGAQVTLIRLGNEVHQPEPSMVISRDQVLYYENLKSNSRVIDSIEEDKGIN
jgi:hypothetical protein